MCTKRFATVLLTTLALLAPTGLTGARAEPIEDPTGLLASDNISIHTTLPEPAAIGARFRDGLMYLTTSAGLAIYDISNPSAPTEVGRLPLPHFENEDVDLGGDILLISNDSAESYGLLHIIDISDPAAPALLTSHHLGGTPASAVIDPFDDILLGDQVPYQGLPGHTASCILECTFAWVTDGGAMRVIDLRDPSVPVNLGNWNTPAGGLAAHDVQVDENGIAWVSGYGGVAGYRIPSDYAEAVSAASASGGTALTAFHNGLIVATTNEQGKSRYIDTAGLDDGSTYNDFILHNSRRLLDSDVVYVTEEDYSRPGCRGAGSFETWRLPMRDEVQEDGTVKRVITGEPMTPIDKWETELLQDTAQPAAMCSAHYFDIKQNVVAQAWYEQGLRLLDVSDPADVRQIGYFIPPNGESWAAYFAPTDPAGRIFYLLDASLGVVVAEYDRPDDGPLAMPPPPAPPMVEDPGHDDSGGNQDEDGKDDDGKDDGHGSGQGSGGSGQGVSNGNGGSGQNTTTVTTAESKKRPCKAKRTRKARRACRKRRGAGDVSAAGAPSSESYEPTVVAPVRAQWISGAPGSAPSSTFGYACRIVV
jgi:hypothetical protein